MMSSKRSARWLTTLLALLCCAFPHAQAEPAATVAVSYTHLDVYKRQG